MIMPTYMILNRSSIHVIKLKLRQYLKMYSDAHWSEHLCLGKKVAWAKLFNGFIQIVLCG